METNNNYRMSNYYRMTTSGGTKNIDWFESQPKPPVEAIHGTDLENKQEKEEVVRKMYYKCAFCKACFSKEEYEDNCPNCNIGNGLKKKFCKIPKEE